MTTADEIKGAIGTLHREIGHVLLHVAGPGHIRVRCFRDDLSNVSDEAKAAVMRGAPDCVPLNLYIEVV